MIRALLLVTTTLLLLTAVPAHAIPTCVFGTMEDYLALTDGCRIGVLTVSDFSYLGVRENPVFVEDILPNFVSVAPSQPYGPSGLRLSFHHGWTHVEIGFRVHVDGPWIQEYALFLLGAFNLSSVGADGLSVSVGEGEFVGGPGGIGIPSARRSFAPIAEDDIQISGGSGPILFSSLGEFAFDAVTPEPTTLLLWAAGPRGSGWPAGAGSGSTGTMPRK